MDNLGCKMAEKGKEMGMKDVCMGGIPTTGLWIMKAKTALILGL